jgi:hypothetical protein
MMPENSPRYADLTVAVYISGSGIQVDYTLGGKDASGICRSFAKTYTADELPALVADLRRHLAATIEGWRVGR